ncbi:MAG: hypothetical protein FWC16_13430 [Defluviitaleaceae bacterium]|nr:hypothetical protein [Defluviitaleaceae bacterium]MCL2275922.1 hypothetical protein [Defluviitaleaceae bacterium]
MEYIRYHMPLYNESAGYDFKGRKPTGRCLLEEKNGTAKLSVWGQDLRPQIYYTLYVIFPENGKFAGVQVTNCAADEKGKIELRREIERTALLGFSVKNAVAVALIHKENGRNNAPLCGYREEKINWLANFYEKIAEKPAAKPVETPVEKAIEKPAPPPKPAPKPKPAPPPSAAHFADPPNLSALSAISPFVGGNNTGIQWVRFTKKDKIAAPATHPNLFKDPFVQASYKEYNHFILGEVTEDETTEYVIGVPDIYSEVQRKKAEKIGFAEFKCYEDTTPAEDEFGYWLMFVGINK